MGIADPVYMSETTWKDFGYRAESEFFIEYDDIEALFDCYVYTIKKQMEWRWWI